jgi:dTDP-4-dehydrorhamnose 3,5-epimerase
VYDAVVDMRRGSPTFGKWEGFHLSDQNKRVLWVPPGFAHGFLCLEDGTDFLYKCTDVYAPAHERSLLWSDAQIGIEWPLDGIEPQVSAKDRAGTPFAQSDAFA